MCTGFVLEKHHCVKDRWLLSFSKHLGLCHKQEIHNFSGLLVVHSRLVLGHKVDRCLSQHFW